MPPPVLLGYILRQPKTNITMKTDSPKTDSLAQRLQSRAEPDLSKYIKMRALAEKLEAEITRLKRIEDDLDWLFSGYAIVRWESEDRQAEGGDPIFYGKEQLREAREKACADLLSPNI